MAAVSDDMAAMRWWGAVIVVLKVCGDLRATAGATGGVRARPWWSLNAACLWGTVALLACSHKWQGRNGVTGVRELSQ